MLYEFSFAGEVNLMKGGKVITFIIVFFFLAPIAAKLLSIAIGHLHKQNEIPGLIPTMIISLVFFFAWLAHTIGAPELLGGFTAGMIIVIALTTLLPPFVMKWYYGHPPANSR